MATINQLGVISARCPGCKGALTNFEWGSGGGQFGTAFGLDPTTEGLPPSTALEHRWYRCVGCQRGAIAAIAYTPGLGFGASPKIVVSFYPEAKERLPLPTSAPRGASAEYAEAERAMDAECYRAAAALLRSALDKTLLANGLRASEKEPLEDQINRAAQHGLITAALKSKAHALVRVLGNDVLHQPWRKVLLEEVEDARRYVHRVIEALYDDRATVLKELKRAGLKPSDDKSTVDAQDEKLISPPELQVPAPAVSKAPPPIEPVKSGRS